MKCNIDSRGKRLRLISGLICLLIGMALVSVAIAGKSPFWAFTGPGLGALAGGAFLIFEARSGWCALRAMGIRTRI